MLSALGIDSEQLAPGLVEVSLPVGYWRKANAVHGWFVDNIQDGEDDCGHYSVDREQLEALRDLCKAALNGDADAREELTPTEGFFFGPTDDEDWYREQLENTVRIIDSALNMKVPSVFWDSFEYHSSW